jgi:hypothetical protein
MPVPAGSAPGVGVAASLAPVRWARAMEVGNQWYDRIAAAAARTDRVERRTAMRDVAARARRLLARPGDVHAHAHLVRMAGRAVRARAGAMADKEDATVANRALAQVAAALAAHQADHGNYPTALDALAPAYLADVPNDPFTNKPLVYRPTKPAYLLYSVGADAKERRRDGVRGRHLEDIASRLPTGDLVVAAGDAAPTSAGPTMTALR